MENFNILTKWDNIPEELTISDICVLAEIKYKSIKEMLDNGNDE